jgi:hypothetical protein
MVTLLRKIPVVVQGFTSARCWNKEPIPSVVGGLGVGSLFVTILGLIAPAGFGPMPSGCILADDLLPLGWGILGIVVGLLLSHHVVAAR